MPEAVPALRLPAGLPLLLATGLGSGLIRPAPGTWGSLLAILLAVPCLLLAPPPWIQPVLALAALTAMVTGLTTIPAAIRQFGRDDPPQVVIDEMAGVWVALAILPPTLLVASPIGSLIVTFLAFRAFDIAKPWPLPRLEDLGGPTGVMADDLAAGLLAGLTTLALLA